MRIIRGVLDLICNLCSGIKQLPEFYDEKTIDRGIMIVSTLVGFLIAYLLIGFN
jgi:hypothetical protein